jgi:hypothetical protein
MKTFLILTLIVIGLGRHIPMSLTIGCLLALGLLLVAIVLAFRAIYRQSLPPECPLCGHREHTEIANQKFFCWFCGHEWTPPK